jgi:hypothetical protein
LRIAIPVEGSNHSRDISAPRLLKAKLDDVNTPYKEKRRHPFATCVRTEREEKRAGAAREERPEGVNPPRI